MALCPALRQAGLIRVVCGEDVTGADIPWPDRRRWRITLWYASLIFQRWPRSMYCPNSYDILKLAMISHSFHSTMRAMSLIEDPCGRPCAHFLQQPKYQGSAGTSPLRTMCIHD